MTGYKSYYKEGTSESTNPQPLSKALGPDPPPLHTNLLFTSSNQLDIEIKIPSIYISIRQKHQCNISKENPVYYLLWNTFFVPFVDSIFQ